MLWASMGLQRYSSTGHGLTEEHCPSKNCATFWMSPWKKLGQPRRCIHRRLLRHRGQPVNDSGAHPQIPGASGPLMNNGFAFPWRDQLRTHLSYQSRMLILCAAGILVFGVACKNKQGSGEVMATVDGVKIYRDEVEKYFR